MIAARQENYHGHNCRSQLEKKWIRFFEILFGDLEGYAWSKYKHGSVNGGKGHNILHEPERFKLSASCYPVESYLPDLYLIPYECYCEIKPKTIPVSSVVGCEGDWYRMCAFVREHRKPLLLLVDDKPSCNKAYLLVIPESLKDWMERHLCEIELEELVYPSPPESWEKTKRSKYECCSDPEYLKARAIYLKKKNRQPGCEMITNGFYCILGKECKGNKKDRWKLSFHCDEGTPANNPDKKISLWGDSDENLLFICVTFELEALYNGGKLRMFPCKGEHRIWSEFPASKFR